MTKERRKETIEGIRRLLIEKGKEEEYSRIPRYSEHSIVLPECNLRLLTLNQTSLVEITEHCRAEVEYQDSPFDIVKKIYRGNNQGLEEIAIKGYYGPDENGKITPAAEKLLRFKDATDQRKVTTTDEERFDNLLTYALRKIA